MLEVLAITGPIFLLMALGYAAVHFKVFEMAQMRVLGRFVLLFCLPALLFHAVSTRRVDEVLVGSYAAAYAMGSIVVMLVGLAWARWRGAPVSLAALQGMGMASPNSGFIGYPIQQQLFGAQAAAGLLALNMLVENLLLLPLALALAGAGGHGQVKKALFEAMRGLVTNPMVIAILLGLVVALLGWRVPDVVDRTVQLLAAAASPLSLFVIGGTLVGLAIQRGHKLPPAAAEAPRDVLRVALGKLVLHPLIVYGFIVVLPPMTSTLEIGLVLTAAMPMMSIYPVLAQKYQHERFCAAALLVATLLSFFTISAGLWWLRHQPGRLA